MKQRRAQREADELNHMTELSRSLAKLIALITVKTGDDGKMFGSVTAGAIADQLKTQFDVALDKKKIHLEQPIKTLGEHEVELRLHLDVVTKLKVRVESSTPVQLPVETAPAEQKDRPARPDRETRQALRACSSPGRRARGPGTARGTLQVPPGQGRKD